jgi:integral membrane sensor domain MASE1
MLEDLQCTKDDAAIEERGAVEMRNYVFVEMDEDGTRVTVPELEAGSEVAGGGEVQARAVPPLWSWLATQSGDFEQRLRSSVDGGGKLLRRTWRKRPRDAKGIVALARRNFITICVVLLSGIITWEISVDSLRSRVNSSVVFPVYIPHAVTLSMACVWRIGVAPGNLIGLYLARIYMAGRGLGFTSVNTTIPFLVCIISTTESHVGAYYLRKCLCKGRGKKLPTIDSVADAVWYLVIVALISFVFATLTAFCVTLSPLVKWRYFWRFWSTMWLGILAAMVTVMPLIIHLLAWRRSPNLTRPAKIIEIVFTVGVSLGIMFVVFIFNLHTFRPMPYLCVPLITYTAFRFNRVGWAFTVTASALFCASGSIRGRGAVDVLSDRAVPYSTNLLIQVV